MMLLMMMMDLMMGTDNLDILKIQVVERSTEVAQLGPPLNFKFNDVFVFRLILKTAFLVFFLFSAAQDNITEVVAELSSISCFFAFFLFLYFAFCFCYCELLFACSRISHGRNDARREVGGLDRARPSPGDNKDYFANCDHEKGKSFYKS